MLVLSRRKGESITFPQVGITIKFVRIQSATAKIGVEAPQTLQIVRDDAKSGHKTFEDWSHETLSVLPSETRHAIRNELHAISVGLHLLKEQVELDMLEDAEETFKTMQDALAAINQQEVLQKPAGVQNIAENTILLVEDDVNEREMLASFLRLKGFTIACAGNGDLALEYLSTHESPRFILLDMKMPQRDGVSTLHEIRSDDRFSDVQVFAISGSTAEENGLEDSPERIDQWFTKPLSIDNLISALQPSNH